MHCTGVPITAASVFPVAMEVKMLQNFWCKRKKMERSEVSCFRLLNGWLFGLDRCGPMVSFDFASSIISYEEMDLVNLCITFIIKIFINNSFRVNIKFLLYEKSSPFCVNGGPHFVSSKVTMSSIF